MNTEQLRKDMEAGTTREFSGTNEQLTNALMHIAERKSTGLTDATICAEAADRIDRLERIALAAEAMADVLEAAIKEHDTGEYGYDEENPWTMREWFEMSDREALAAYRESTK